MHRSMDDQLTPISYSRFCIARPLYALLAFVLIGCTSGGDNNDPADDGLPPVGTWELVWSDEFEGNALDLSKWEVELGDGKAEGLTGWGNGEEQYYSADNITVADGNLVINSRAETITVSDPNDPVANTGTYDYTSGRIRTQGLFDFTYGRVEASIKMPAAQGIWSAFWLLGTDPSPYGTWAAKGEIDIVETYARGLNSSLTPFASSAIHFGGPFPFNIFDTKSTNDFEADVQTFNPGADPFPGPGFDFFDDFHTYAVEWDEEEIRFYIDGVNYYSVKATNFWAYYTDVDDGSAPQGTSGNTDVGAKIKDVIKYSSPASEERVGYQAAEGDAAPFDSLFHIILNSAVGGTLPNVVGEPPSTADIGVSGDDMLVEYVRVYRCNLADPITGLGGNLCKNNEGRPGIELPEDPDNPGETILPNFTNDYLAASSTVYDLFSTEFDIYVDGPDAERIPNGPELTVQAFGAAAWTNETEASGNSYIRMTTSASGLQGVAIEGSEELIIAGIDGLSDIKFDLYLESDYNGTPITQTDLETGGPGGNQRILRLSMTSGDDSEGKFFFIPLDGVGLDTWRRFTIPLQYLLSDGGNLPGGGLDLGDVSRLVEFAVAGINVRIDNIGFACGGQPCGVVGEVDVFIDEIDPIWDRGIVGDDTFQRFRVPSNADYTDPDCCHVQWDIVDLGAGELDFDGLPRNQVVETRFGTTNPPTVGAVNFLGASTPFPSIAALRDGEFSFDIRVTRNDENAQVLFKIDANGGPGAFSSTGEQPLGDLPLGVWTRFACPITTLESQGLDTSRITAPFVIVPGNRGSAQGMTVQWDNVRFSTTSSATPTELILDGLNPILFDALPAFCLPIAPFAGGAFQIVDNPDATVGSLNTNTRVGELQKFDTGDGGVTFGGITLNLTTSLMFGDVTDPTDKLFKIWAYSPRAGLPVTVKLESVFGQSRGVGRVFTTTQANTWEEFELDFNGSAMNEFSGITLISDDGVAGDGSDDFKALFDNIRLEAATSSVADLVDVSTGPIVPVLYDYDAADTQYQLFDFGEARSGIETNGPPGSNGNVARVFLGDFATTFAGTVIGGFGGFPNPIPFDVGRTTIQMRVYTDTAPIDVSLKAEDAVDNLQAAEVTATANSVGWNTLEFDFSTQSINTADSFEKLVIVFKPGITRTGETFYFDDIQLLAP